MVSFQHVHEKDAPKLHNIMQFYIYEFSKYIPEIKLEDNGSYKPFDLEKYWTNNNFHAYFIENKGELIGFALVESAAFPSPNTIQEYFILAKYQGCGFGKEGAKQLFSMFPGAWEITQIEKNKPAQAFWRRLINEVSGGHFSEEYTDGVYIQKFNT
ncbi:GNAT family N-acetyltransferase [Halobacillus yeomjeoni]|uniref:GNAT family N-acetyltransferase n=1 Tax=Halobacillus yeomjeoni TaxID=311194 RepID=UPI001CD28E88|nr:GNAT family N-acetyltransferase [Halobacillus yeomjeoni]MCA0983517.1 GNAT family N-acetyltransferase [Halobacillus yeomjeoni]